MTIVYTQTTTCNTYLENTFSNEDILGREVFLIENDEDEGVAMVSLINSLLNVSLARTLSISPDSKQL